VLQVGLAWVEQVTLLWWQLRGYLLETVALARRPAGSGHNALQWLGAEWAARDIATPLHQRSGVLHRAGAYRLRQPKMTHLMAILRRWITSGFGLA
jgi:hypothetical protein